MGAINVLLVDDEAVFAGNMSRLLAKRGYAVAAAHSGGEAIDRLRSQSFDVVVLDLKMPDMDGIATLQEIKRLGLDVETLMLTGHGSIDTALEAIQMGAYDYLTKPCEIGELVAKIESARQRKKLREERSG
jgi:DNA-binding NtrC family response regulator